MERVKKELNVEIGRRLREIRENMGYTQFRFAEILGVVEEHYRKIELGSSGLTLEKVLILYERLNIDATYLIVGKRKDKFDLDDISTQLANAILFAVLIIVLLVKPSGLLGKYVPEKV